MHKTIPLFHPIPSLPILHIADTAASAIKAKNINRIALLGTKYTMEQDFYKEKLIAAGIDVLIPEKADRQIIQDIIYQELCHGKIQTASRKEFLRIIENLANKGAQGVILGCTEIGLLIQQKGTPLPVFDTTILHAQAAARLALNRDFVCG